MAIRITCINKAGGQHSDPHTAITNLGWVNESTGKEGKSTRLEIYKWLKENSANQAYVKDQFGNVAYLGTRENQHGTQFVQTYRDKTWTDNLLALPECVN
jgi:hypothetical protein